MNIVILISGIFISSTSIVLMALLRIYGRNKLHTIWFMTNLVIFVWGLGCFFIGKSSSIEEARFWWGVAVAAGVFIAPCFYQTTYIFAGVKQPKRLIISYLQASLFAILALFTEVTLNKYRILFGNVYYPTGNLMFFLMIICWVIVIFLGTKVLFDLLKRSTGKQHLQTWYLLIAFLSGFVGGGATLLPAFDLPYSFVYPFGNFGVAIYAIIGTYAVLRYQLLDLNVAFTRAGIFGVVYALVLGVPFWLGYKYNKWQYSTWFMLVLATSGPFIYSYLRRHAENIILRDQRRYQKALRELAETMTHIRSLDALIQIITTTMVNAVKVNFAAMYVKEEESNSYVLKSCNPQSVQDKFPENLAFDSSVVKFILAEQRLITCDEIKNKPEIPLECGLVIPCFMENDLLAFIALGTKPNSQMFTTDDILVFETVSYSASIAIENCRFWREIEDKQRKARLQEMDTYSYSLAHEIDNPVHIILNETTLIKDYLLKNITNPQEYKEAESACGFTIEAARRVAGMVKAIRDFGSPVTGKALALKIEDVVESFFKLYYPQFKDKAIVFEKIFFGDLGFIRGIKPELMQVLVILANNSIHAMRESEIKKITLKVEPVNHDRIRIVFSDTGYGIKKENLEIIFLPFTTTKASSEGTGMGLYNAKKIIERHNGKIFAQSEGKGQGACFVIELPKALDVTEDEFLKEGQKEKRLI
ncbi:MAG: hypothetical protein HZC15_06175 [Candidatus Omnitrophica bacterium]|nr:hypothetical protein [Candidatus Omnitrophota bacterium]